MLRKLTRLFSRRFDKRKEVLQAMADDPDRWWGGYDLMLASGCTSAQLYLSLAQLERAGHVKDNYHALPESFRGRRLYRVTPSGTQALKDGLPPG